MIKLLKNNLPLILILLVAAFLRLYRIADYMTFLGDEGRDVLVVYNILHGQFTLLGPTASVGGFFLGPIYYYFMTPFLFLFNYNPVGPAVMVALFGVATVALVYRISSEFFDKRTAIIASALYSISPLVINYSHSSWNPNLMPFFSLLTLYVLYKAIEYRKNLLIIATGFLLGITMQLHYLATFLGVIIGIYLLILGYPKFAQIVKKYLFLCFGFLIGWSPFLAFEFRHGFNNIESIFAFVFNPTGKDAIAEGIGFFPTLYSVFLRVFGRLIAGFPPPDQYYLYSKQWLFVWQAGIILIGIFSLYLIFKKTYISFKLKNHYFEKYLLLSVWIMLGILLFGFYRKQIYDYYFVFMFPLPFILVGNLFSSLLDSRKYRYLSVSLIMILFALNLNGVPFRFEPNRQLKQAETIARFVVDKTDGEPYNFALVSNANSDYAYRYFFTIWDREPVVIQNPSVDPERSSVTDQLLVVCEISPCHPLGWAAWEVAGFGRAEILNEWPVSVVQVDKLIHYKGK